MHAARRIMVWSAGPAVIAAMALALSAQAGRSPLVLFNSSQSVPTGFYRRIRAPVRPGELIAFRVPPAGRAYAAAHLPARLRTSILKPVVAGPGAQVCADRRRLTIDEQDVAIIADRDRHGVALPHWTGCRILGADEVFVLSTRIPNSYDSRYYGPVSGPDILGVYALLWRPWAAPGPSGRA
jgi:type IV secretory pathway protease TraF